MSIGNLKTDGGKGTNWPWQYKMLKGLQGIIDVINSTANGSEYEAKLVNITCTGVPFNGTELYLEVRVWDTVTGGFTGSPTYYLPGSTIGVPLATFTNAGCTIEYLEAGDATEVTLQAVLSTLNSTTVIPGMLRKNATAVPGVFDVITDSVKSITFANYSAVDAKIGISNLAPAPVVAETILQAGEVITFDAGGNANKFPASIFSYNPDPTPGINGDLLITYTI
tara:strand:- start:65 stop:736 length:672 start_codon:yes stop_codon:yes gene_type:complete